MSIFQKSIITLGIVLFGIILVLNYNLQALKEWKEAKGILIYATTQNASSPTDGAASDFAGEISKIKYTYIINNKKYFGNRVMPLEFLYLKKEIVSNLPKPNNRVKVFYNPKKPAQSFLFKSYPYIQIYMLFFVAILILLLGFFYDKIKKIFILLIHPSSSIGTGGY